MRLNVHFHTLAIDGVYVRNEHGELRFVDLGEPSAADVHEIAAWLLRRVFAVDVSRCPRCDGAMRLVTIATDPDDIAEVLDGRPRSRAPPAWPGQLHLAFDTTGPA